MSSLPSATPDQRNALGNLRASVVETPVKTLHERINELEIINNRCSGVKAHLTTLASQLYGEVPQPSAAVNPQDGDGIIDLLEFHKQTINALLSDIDDLLNKFLLK